MPGSVQNVAPSAVMPATLCTAFEHFREYPVAVSLYQDGSSQRGLLANSSRKSWRLAKRLTPTLLSQLRSFYEARAGPLQPFYFYDPFETNPPFLHDPTGVATSGRYTVRFEGEWAQTVGIARGGADIRLVEVA